MQTEQQIPSVVPGVVFLEMGEGAVLYHPGRETYYSLNEVAAFCWSLLPPVHSSLSDAIAAVAAKYPEAPRDVIARDMAALFESLQSAGLVRYEAQS